MSTVSLFPGMDEELTCSLRETLQLNPLLAQYLQVAQAEIANQYVILDKPPISAGFEAERHYLQTITELKVAQEIIDHLFASLTP